MNQEMEEFLDLQLVYLNQLKEKNPNIEESELVMKNFPFGWFSSNDYDRKMQVLKKALEEKKTLVEYDEGFEIANKKPVHMTITPVNTEDIPKSK